MVRADTGRDTELQVLGLHANGAGVHVVFSADPNRDSPYLLEELGCEVSGVERCGDQDLSLKKGR